MTSLFSQEISDNVRIELFKISNEIILPEFYLNEEEKIELSNITNEQRKKEWQISRFLVQEVCKKLNIRYEGTTKDAIGRLWLKNSQFHVSISHCEGYCAVVVSKIGFCGIDIEPISERVKKLSKKFLSERELALAGDEATIHTLFWSAKEAMYKIAGRKGIIFANDLFINYIDNELEGKILNNGEYPDFNIFHKKFDNLVLVWLLER